MDYTKRLDEILNHHAQEFKAGHLDTVHSGITQLFRDMIKEAKPKP